MKAIDGSRYYWRKTPQRAVIHAGVIGTLSPIPRPAIVRHPTALALARMSREHMKGKPGDVPTPREDDWRKIARRKTFIRWSSPTWRDPQGRTWFLRDFQRLWEATQWR